jgi:hypothetical protein
VVLVPSCGKFSPLIFNPAFAQVRFISLSRVAHLLVRAEAARLATENESTERSAAGLRLV